MGRKVWVRIAIDDMTPFFDGPYQVMGIRAVLHAGPIKGESLDSSSIVPRIREKTLIQIWSDTGMRTLSVADIWMHDPGKSDAQW